MGRAPKLSKFVGSTATASCTVDVIPIAEGTYFLRNRQTYKYADIQGPTMVAGTTIHQWEFHGGNSQKWIFEYHGSGYYSLKSANSTTAYYLGVKDDLDAEETPIVLRSGTITDGMLWRALTTTSGAYRLTPKTGNWCLATTVSTQTNGDKLHQDWYAENTSYRDEWGIIPEFTMALFAIPDEDDTDGRHDHSSALESIIGMGGWSTYTFLDCEASPSEVKLGLDTKDIYISRSHGGYVNNSSNTAIIRTGILLNDIPPSSNAGIGLWSHYGNGIESGSSYISDNEDYSNISIALFVACYTGKDGPDANNLPTKVVNRGAEVAIGFEISIDCNAANTWTSAFWDAMLNGATVNSAVHEACDATENNISYEDVVICGNESYRLVLQ